MFSTLGTAEGGEEGGWVVGLDRTGEEIMKTQWVCSRQEKERTNDGRGVPRVGMRERMWVAWFYCAPAGEETCYPLLKLPGCVLFGT